MVATAPSTGVVRRVEHKILQDFHEIQIDLRLAWAANALGSKHQLQQQMRQCLYYNSKNSELMTNKNYENVSSM